MAREADPPRIHTVLHNGLASLRQASLVGDRARNLVRMRIVGVGKYTPALSDNGDCAPREEVSATDTTIGIHMSQKREVATQTDSIGDCSHTTKLLPGRCGLVAMVATVSERVRYIVPKQAEEARCNGCLVPLYTAVRRAVIWTKRNVVQKCSFGKTRAAPGGRR